MSKLRIAVAFILSCTGVSGCGRTTVPNPCTLLTTQEVQGLSERVAYYSLEPQPANNPGKACAWKTDTDKAIVMLVASPGAGKNIEQELKAFFRSGNIRVAPISGLGASAAAAFTTEGSDETLVALMATDGPFTLNMLAPAGGESSATFAKASELMKAALDRAKAAK